MSVTANRPDAPGSGGARGRSDPGRSGPGRSGPGSSGPGSSGPGGPGALPAAAAVPAAIEAAVATLVGCVVPAMIAWIVPSSTDAAWTRAVRVGADVWLLGHGATVDLADGGVGLTPLGVTALCLGACALLVHRAQLSHGGTGGTATRGFVMTFAGCYAALASVVAMLAGSSSARPSVWQSTLGAGLVSGAAALAVLRTCPLGRLPARLRVVALPAATSVASLIAMGALLVSAALLAGFGRSLQLHRALDPGPVGGATLVLLQVLVLPDLVLWAVAWLVGPGFAVGMDTVVSPAASRLEALPALPVLGALPLPGPLPGWIRLGLLVPVAAGALGAVRLPLRRRAGDRLADAALLALTGGVVLGLLASWSAGSAGPGRMERLGPSGWGVGAAVAAEFGVGTLLVSVLRGVAALPGAVRREPNRLRRWLVAAGDAVRSVLRGRRTRAAPTSRGPGRDTGRTVGRAGAPGSPAWPAAAGRSPDADTVSQRDGPRPRRPRRR